MEARTPGRVLTGAEEDCDTADAVFDCRLGGSASRDLAVGYNTDALPRSSTSFGTSSQNPESGRF